MHTEFSWQAGLAAVDITPTEPIWLDGWARRDKPLQGVDQPIFAKALALKDIAGDVSVLVTTDLLGFSGPMVASMTRQAAQRFGLPRQRLVLNASHNHSGPVLRDVLPLYFDLPAREYEVIDRYTQRLETALLQAIEQALERLAPARLDYGCGQAGFAVNRRRARPGQRHWPNVVDHDVPVLRVTAPSGALRGLVFGYACHATAIDTSRVNGDYPGYAQAALEQMHPGAVAMFLAGCGADANPLPRFRPELIEVYGRILAAAADEVLLGQPRPLHEPLTAASTTVKLPLEPAPGRDQLQAALENANAEAYTRRACQYLRGLLDRGPLPTHLDYTVQLWRFGSDLDLILLTGETVADYALRFKTAYGFDRTWVSGYNNELLAYVPSRRVRLEGDYEGGTGMWEYGHPAPFKPELEDLIANAVETLRVECGAAAVTL